MIEYEELGISDIKPYEHNARKHSSSQIEMICESLKEFGFVNPVIVDENNNILAGHGRYEAAKKLGLDRIPVRRVSGLSEEKKKAYLLVDNKLYDEGSWNYDLLHTEAESIELDMTRFGYDSLFNDDEEKDDSGGNPISNGGELSLGDFQDERFEYVCPECGFAFNKGGKH